MNEQFVPGTHIRCGSYGVCLIDRMEEVIYPDGDARQCYVLKPVRSPNTEISVPVGSGENLKPLLTKNEIDKILADAALSEEIAWTPERKQRGNQFRKILSDGDSFMLLRMVQCIRTQKKTLESAGKRLSASDDNVRRDAERMLDEEFGFSLGLSADEAKSYIAAHMNVKL